MSSGPDWPIEQVSGLLYREVGVGRLLNRGMGGEVVGFQRGNKEKG